jgi:hypothetical protein
MLVHLFEENGLRITAAALSGYMKKLNEEVGKVSGNQAHKGGSQPLSPGSEARGPLAI